MNRHSDLKGGYVGLVSLLIGIALMSFIALRMYTKSTDREQNPLRDDTYGKSAIEKAREVKDALENQNKGEIPVLE